MRRKAGRDRGQALVEAALVMPILVLLMLGAADLARAFYFNIEIAGSSRAGMRTGVQGQGNDIGVAIRSESNNAIPDDATTWGQEAQGGTYGDCTSTAQKCGDPGGCAPASFQPGQLACFAIRSCTISGSACGTPFGLWGSRPDSSTELALQVHVVYRFSPFTPMVSNLAGPGGILYLAVDSYGLEMY
jgi:hypothetical protein